MNNRTLTSANAILLIGVTGLYDVPQQIQGFTADDITSFDPVNSKQTSMGLDGRLSAGYVPMAINQSITLQADSASIDFFENWIESERQLREAFPAFGSLIVQSVGKEYSMTRGFLSTAPVAPGLRNTVQPRQFSITWERVSPAGLF